MKRGHVLLIHGSSSPEATAESDGLLAMLRERMPGDTVAAAYLRSSGPDLGTVVQGMVTEGYRDIVVMPLFLMAGNHTLEGIPRAIRELGDRFPGVSVTLTRHIGADPMLVGIIEDRFRNA